MKRITFLKNTEKVAAHLKHSLTASSLAHSGLLDLIAAKC